MPTNSTSKSAPSIEVTCESFKPFQKNTLQGFCTIVFPAIGLRVLECTYHKKGDDHFWVGFPAREYTRNGERQWARIIEASDSKAHYAMQDSMVEAVTRFLLLGGGK